MSRFKQYIKIQNVNFCVRVFKSPVEEICKRDAEASTICKQNVDNGTCAEIVGTVDIRDQKDAAQVYTKTRLCKNRP